MRMSDPVTELSRLNEFLNKYKNHPAFKMDPPSREPASAPVADPVPDVPDAPRTANDAINECYEAYRLAWQAAKARGATSSAVKIEADHAFRTALPPLVGFYRICDFIACVAHGVLLGAISGADSSKLLYAAQVASSTTKYLGNSFSIPPGYCLQKLESPDDPSSGF
jgi:hypothetical protein